MDATGTFDQILSKQEGTCGFLRRLRWTSSRWHTGVGGGIWMGVFASGAFFQFVSSLKATVVRSDEGTSFYFFSGFGL